MFRVRREEKFRINVNVNRSPVTVTEPMGGMMKEKFPASLREIVIYLITCCCFFIIN